MFNIKLLHLQPLIAWLNTEDLIKFQSLSAVTVSTWKIEILNKQHQTKISSRNSHIHVMVTILTIDFEPALEKYIYL